MAWLSHPDEIIHLISRCTADDRCRVCQPIPANTTVTSPVGVLFGGGGTAPAPTPPRSAA